MVDHSSPTLAPSHVVRRVPSPLTSLLAVTWAILMGNIGRVNWICTGVRALTEPRSSRLGTGSVTTRTGGKTVRRRISGRIAGLYARWTISVVRMRAIVTSASTKIAFSKAKNTSSWCWPWWTAGIRIMINVLVRVVIVLHIAARVRITIGGVVIYRLISTSRSGWCSLYWSLHCHHSWWDCLSWIAVIMNEGTVIDLAATLCTKYFLYNTYDSTCKGLSWTCLP